MPAEPPALGSLQSANLPEALRADLLPALQELVARHHPEGLWLFGSWARGSASRRSDVDLLVMGLADRRLLDAYDAVLETLQPCRLPVQPLVASPALLRKHGDAPFWRSVKAEAIPLLQGCLPVSMSQEGARHRARLWLAQAQACFLAQQVGEKAIKALLAADDRDLRSHSLSALLRVLDKLDAPTRDPDALGDDLPAAVFGPEDATAALEAAEALLGWAGEALEVSDGV